MTVHMTGRQSVLNRSDAVIARKSNSFHSMVSWSRKVAASCFQRSLANVFELRSIVSAALVGFAITMSSVPGAAKAEDVKVSDDLTLHYEKSGHGPIPIVFVPGWTMSSEVFVRQLEHFKSSEQYTFYSYDPRGQGRSSHTEGGHFYEQRGRDLNAFLDTLGLTGVVLAGWSYGALDVSSYLHEYGPGNLRSFILIDGTPKTVGDDNSKEWVWYRKDDSDGFRQFFTMPVLLNRQQANEDFAKWMLEDPSPENLKWVSDISNQTSDSVAALLNESGAYENYESDVKALEGKIPLLFVVRTEWSDIMKGWAAKNTPSARVEAMGKHLLFWERADEFNSVLDSFLSQIKP